MSFRGDKQDRYAGRDDKKDFEWLEAAATQGFCLAKIVFDRLQQQSVSDKPKERRKQGSDL